MCLLIGQKAVLLMEITSVAIYGSCQVTRLDRIQGLGNRLHLGERNTKVHGKVACTHGEIIAATSADIYCSYLSS